MPRVNATFDGVNRLIVLDQAVTTVAVLDLYSDWKEWAQSNSGYTRAFLSSGGDVSSTGDLRGQYIDITNGWQIDTNSSVVFQGNVFRDSLDPIGSTLSVIKEEAGVKSSTFLVSNLAGAVQVPTGSGLSTQQNTWLSELHQTLQSAGVLSGSALANSPSDATAETQSAIVNAIAQLKDIADLFGYTPGIPVTVNEATGVITTNDGRRVELPTVGDVTTITRNDP